MTVETIMIKPTLYAEACPKSHCAVKLAAVFFLSAAITFGGYGFAAAVPYRDTAQGSAEMAGSTGKDRGTPAEEKSMSRCAYSKNCSETARQNNEFGIELYSRLRSGKGNIFFSPYSISTVMAMTYAGSRGLTREEIAGVLRFTGDKAAFHKTFSALRDEIGTVNQTEGLQLKSADSLWMQKGYGYRKEFLNVVRRYYGSSLFEVNFSRSPETARTKINKWVDENTGHKINELFGQGLIRPDTRLVLADAIYFSGLWASRFDGRLTRQDLFHADAGKDIPIRMMHREGTFRTAGVPGMSLIELPYKGDSISMVILLPDETGALGSLEERMTLGNIEGWLDALLRSRKRDVELALPRFALNGEFELSRTLTSMGMKHVFAGNADFSGITGRKDLAVSAVVHKARVEVKEEGTQAVAATGVIMTKGVREKVHFTVDHPFIFIIRHNPTGQILFMGRVMEPKA